MPSEFIPIALDRFAHLPPDIANGLDRDVAPPVVLHRRLFGMQALEQRAQRRGIDAQVGRLYVENLAQAGDRRAAIAAIAIGKRRVVVDESEEIGEGLCRGGGNGDDEGRTDKVHRDTPGGRGRDIGRHGRPGRPASGDRSIRNVAH